MIVYRTVLSVGALIGGGVLDLGEPVHDYAQVSLNNADDQFLTPLLHMFSNDVSRRFGRRMFTGS